MIAKLLKRGNIKVAHRKVSTFFLLDAIVLIRPVAHGTTTYLGMKSYYIAVPKLHARELATFNTCIGVYTNTWYWALIRNLASILSHRHS